MLNQDQASPKVTEYFSTLVEHRRQLDSKPLCSCCSSSRKSVASSSGLLQLHTPRRLGLAIGTGIMAALTGVQASSFVSPT
jgi:hypothetical protein